MLHTLVLVKIKNRGAEHHLKALFQIALIDSYLSTQFADGDGVSDMLE